MSFESLYRVLVWVNCPYLEDHFCVQCPYLEDHFSKTMTSIKGFNVSNEIIDGMGFPTRSELILLLAEVHVFTDFPMELPTE